MFTLNTFCHSVPKSFVPSRWQFSKVCALKGNFPGPKTSPVYRGMPQPQGKTTKDLESKVFERNPRWKSLFCFLLIPQRHAALWLINAGGEAEKRAFWCQDPAEDGRQMLPSGGVVCDRIPLSYPHPTSTDNRKPIY